MISRFVRRFISSSGTMCKTMTSRIWRVCGLLTFGGISCVIVGLFFWIPWWYSDDTDLFVWDTLPPRDKHSQKASLDSRILSRMAVDHSGRIFPPDSALPLTLTAPYIIPNALMCRSFRQLLYVIVVQTAPSNFQQRQTLRQTWANQTLFYGTNSRTVFFLGRTSNESIRNQIHTEFTKYGDIVQGDFVDHYENLTLKTVLRMRWVSEFCMNAKFVIKVDDDVFLNTFYVKENYFPILEQNPNQIIGWVAKPSIIRPRHIEVAKWHLPDEQFKDMGVYPMPMCYGFANFFTTMLAKKLFEMAKSTPFVRLEDVYLTGILAAKIKDISWRNEAGKFFKSYNETYKQLRTKGPDFLVVGTMYNATEANTLWELLNKLRSLND